MNSNDTDPIFTYTTSIITTIVVLSGMIGNVLAFIVYSRPTFRKNSISVYCRALAIFEMFIVISIILDYFFIFHQFFLANYSDALCMIYAYAYFAFSSIPGWILIAFSIDKVLNMTSVSQRMKRLVLHYTIVIVIVLFNLLLYIEVPIYMRLFPVEISGKTVYVCDPTLLSFGKALSIIFIIQGNVLPFVIMFVSSIIIIKKLRDSRRQVRIGAGEKRKSRDAKFAVTSLTFNIMFIVMKTPVVVCVAIGLSIVEYHFFKIAVAFFFINYSISFFIHFASNSLFRRELMIILRIRKDKTNSILQPNQANRQSTIKDQSQKTTQDNRQQGNILTVDYLD